MTRDCVKCDDSSHLQCPTCSKGKSCQYQIATDCSKCDQAVCVENPGSSDSSSGGSKSGGGGPNTGAIAGGVVGGVVVVAILTYLAWRFLIKPRRAEAAQSSMYEVGGMNPAQESEKDGASRLTRRSSTHTVHSIASTVLTRASNIIQIAYIPGVTNRTNPSSAGSSLVPPVPPIPAQHTGGTQNSANDDQHFFMPGDLRDSTYSGLSGYTDRTSYATRTSYAPRSSIASTIYGKQAQVMAPAQNGMRVKPTMVSVKGVNGSPDSTPPPVPSINFERIGGSGRPESGASAFSVGSTFLNTATQARAQVVKVGGGLRKVDIGGKSDASSSKSSIAGSSGHGVPATGAITLINDTNSPRVNSPTVTVSAPDQGPFSDPPDGQQTMRSGGSPSLGPVMEAELEGDSVMKKSETRGGATSPFGDEHATK